MPLPAGVCCCIFLRIPEVISERMLQLKPVEMRLELKEGINHCSVINDSYSADLTSLSMALDFYCNSNSMQNAP